MFSPLSLDESITNVTLQNRGHLVCFPSSVGCQVSRLKDNKQKSFPAVARLEYGFAKKANKVDDETAGEVKQRVGEYVTEHGHEGMHGICVLERRTDRTRYIARVGSLGVTGDIYALPDIEPFSNLTTQMYLEESYDFLTISDKPLKAFEESTSFHVRMQISNKKVTVQVPTFEEISKEEFERINSSTLLKEMCTIYNIPRNNSEVMKKRLLEKAER